MTSRLNNRNLPNKMVEVEVVVGTYEGVIRGYKFDLLNREKGLTASFSEQSHASIVKSVACSGSHLAVGGYDNTIKIFNMKKRIEVGTLVRHNGTISWLTFHKDTHLFSASEDGTIGIWEVGTWEYLKTLRGHKSNVNCFSVHPSGKLALSVSKDRTLRTWNLLKAKIGLISNLKEVGNLVTWNHTGSGYAIAFETFVTIYNVEDGSTTSTLSVGKHINTIVYIKDDVMAVGSEYNTIKFYSTLSGVCLHELEGHTKRVKSLQVLLGDGYLFSVSSDETLKVWKLNSEDVTSSSLIHEASVSAWPVTLAVVPPALLTSSDRKSKMKVDRSGVESTEDEKRLVNKKVIIRQKRKNKFNLNRKRIKTLTRSRLEKWFW